MSAAGITSIRVPVPWSSVQPSGPDSFDWSGLDQVTEVAARNGLEIFPFLYSTPAWVAPSYTTLPIDTVAQQEAWAAFLRAAVRRYGPEGSFWSEHGSGSAEPLTEQPIRNWQIWNEANFFYFATPASPERYGNLLLQSRDPILKEDPDARIVLSGLFGSPREEPPRAMDAVTFLRRLYRVEGIGSYFDVAALHPYASDSDDLAQITGAFRNVMFEFGDAASPLWITEMGWGSGRGTAFEKGVNGQAEQLDAAYTYLLANQHALNLERTYWFSWKDDPPPYACNFCDSVGLFEAGEGLRPKPAWFEFVEVTGGSP